MASEKSRIQRQAIISATTFVHGGRWRASAAMLHQKSRRPVNTGTATVMDLMSIDTKKEARMAMRNDMEGIDPLEIEHARELLKDKEAREIWTWMHETMIEHGYHAEKTLLEFCVWERARRHDPPEGDCPFRATTGKQAMSANQISGPYDEGTAATRAQTRTDNLGSGRWHMRRERKIFEPRPAGEREMRMNEGSDNAIEARLEHWARRTSLEAQMECEYRGRLKAALQKAIQANQNPNVAHHLEYVSEMLEAHWQNDPADRWDDTQDRVSIFPVPWAGEW